MDNLDEYYSVVNNEFKGNNEEYVDLINYLGYYSIYFSNPYEVSAMLAEKGIKDGQTIIQRWTEFAERFDKKMYGRSGEQTSQVLHTQRPTNSSMSFGQLGEPSDKRGKLDNEYGQFGKIQKQPNSGTVEQFSPKLQQNKSKYPRTPKGRRNFMEYGEGDGMPESGVSKEISERRGSSKLDEDGFAKPVQSGEQRLAPTPQSFIKSIRNSSKHQEQIKIDFDIITQDQASNRLKQQSSGDDVYFKQGVGKGDNKIDLTRNYNEIVAGFRHCVSLCALKEFILEGLIFLIFVLAPKNSISIFVCSSALWYVLLPFAIQCSRYFSIKKEKV